MGVGPALVALRMLGYRGPWPYGRGFDAAEDGEADLGLAYFMGVVSLVLCVWLPSLWVFMFVVGFFARLLALSWP